MGPAIVIPRRVPSLYCSFCGKRDDEVRYLVSGPQVFICDECVEVAGEVGRKMLARKALADSANNGGDRG